MNLKLILFLFAFNHAKGEEITSDCDVENPCYSVILTKTELYKIRLNESDEVKI